MAGEITVDISELTAFASRIQGSSGIVQQEMGTAMDMATRQVQADAMRDAPVRTGTLRRSITATVTPLLGEVGTNVPYARAVHDGRREVRPVSAKVLRWVDPSGRVVFARRSRATQGKPFLRNAFERNRSGIIREFSEAGKRAIARIVSGR